MQTYEGNELKATEILEEKNLSQKVEEVLKEEKSTHVIIGRLPKKGQEIKINGLIFRVIYSDFVTGIVHLRLKRPSDDDKNK